MTRIRGGGEFDFRGAWKAKAEFFACISFQKSSLDQKPRLLLFREICWKEKTEW